MPSPLAPRPAREPPRREAEHFEGAGTAGPMAPVAAPGSAQPPADPEAVLRKRLERASRLGHHIARVDVASRVRSAPPLVQRVKLNLRQNGTISGVSKFPHRPPSNVRGSQGQHMTAYVVFEDMILSHVRDQTPAQAAIALGAVLDDIARLPGMDAKGAGYLRDAIANTKQALIDAMGDPGEIGDAIDTILAIRNQVPGTAVTGEGGGHGESGQSGILVELETALRTNSWPPAWDPKVVAGQAQYAMWRLFDYDPPEPDSQDKLDTVAKRLLIHFLSLRMAYPSTFQWMSADKSRWLFPYLKKNRLDPGMPLQNLSGGTLDAVEQEVYKGM